LFGVSQLPATSTSSQTMMSARAPVMLPERPCASIEGSRSTARRFTVKRSIAQASGWSGRSSRQSGWRSSTRRTVATIFTARSWSAARTRMRESGSRRRRHAQ